MYPLLNSYIIVLFGYLNCCTRSLKSWENCFKIFFPSCMIWKYENSKCIFYDMKKASAYFKSEIWRCTILLYWFWQKHIFRQRDTQTHRQTDGRARWLQFTTPRQQNRKKTSRLRSIRQISLTYFLVTFFPCNILWMISSFDRNKTATTKTCKKRGQWVNFVFVSLYIVFSYICYRILSVSSLVQK